MSDICACDEAPKLIFACSGAADVGALSDQAARRLSKEGAGKMYCMAGIGGRIPPILEQTGKAKGILAIDGCPSKCVKSSLQQAGFSGFKHFQLEQVGLMKGHAPMSEETLNKVMARGRDLLAAI